MKQKLSDILKGVGVIEQVNATDCEVEQIVFDSRKANGNTLFVAMKGTVVDGHQFIPQVLEAGCKCVVCEVIPAEYPADAMIVKVDDSSVALGHMAANFYDNPSDKLKLVGVTGTNGKTTTATLLYHLVMSMGYKAGLFSTVANFIGKARLDATHTTPDAVTLNKTMSEMVEAGCEYCFMEVSSHALVQNRVTGLKFAGGLFTNITHDHLDYHGTFKEYIAAKKSFFDGLSKQAFALTNADDKNGQVMLQNTAAQTYTYSLKGMGNYKGRIIESMFEGMQLEIDGQEIWTQFVGHFNAQNLLLVYGAACLLGFEKEDVQVAISQLNPVDGRFETMRSKSGKTAIVDYAHTPDALKNVIETINLVRQPSQQLVTVVGAGGDRDPMKRPEMAKEAVGGSSKVILTSDNPRSEEPEAIIEQMMEGVSFKERIKVLSIVNRREAIRTACMVAGPGDIILIAGKGHETYQEIKGVRSHFDDREIVREVFNEE
ncbi:UDP-N-acetylmuramoyl-L-alanyl-D-glutamate--2,6-diaminopimelate ligase [Carboxylicivirga sediminis]|uniref:UDP-N-acetylmuramoyl-L-alanyl-D-glutamate--2,6-diaminopimelate ligase n=1 Tax=Carboxylicivirga sediminis TaxID=2006564 RepID=A0A941FC35_9BACT|nr:UDP-N-acetylmuramoyl-L-alanyl-D-glutamate--2,6-diaminopimelate ligase [Carboxylicivirga sediminis]MBR8538055.1 UDP-N-acetylmuramoyl-L-alanyl-D-glutamate--2,6-diaminopimelate ligase [Carboxylicivirga sediminis]